MVKPNPAPNRTGPAGSATANPAPNQNGPAKSNVPSIADILSTRKRRLDLQRQADVLEQEEKAQAESLIQWMVALGMDEARNGDDIAYLKSSEEPTVTSWPLVLNYIVHNNAPELLQKRLTPSAVKERWVEGEIVPGIEKVTKRSLKFNI